MKLNFTCVEKSQLKLGNKKTIAETICFYKAVFYIDIMIV